MADQIMDWKSEQLREKVATQIENSLKWTALSSKELENSVYQRAKTREEYLELAAKSILKEKERNMTDWRAYKRN
uniref:Mediator of RNA polymerase II transcription subunit 15 n=1 Tax=Magallana gigas TaxID=29159 RepID=K1QQX0_MAGGI